MEQKKPSYGLYPSTGWNVNEAFSKTFYLFFVIIWVNLRKVCIKIAPVIESLIVVFK